MDGIKINLLLLWEENQNLKKGGGGAFSCVFSVQFLENY